MLYLMMLEVFSNLNDPMISMISMIQHPPVLLSNVVSRIPATPWHNLQMSPVPPADDKGSRVCKDNAAVTLVPGSLRSCLSQIQYQMVLFSFF